MRNQSIYTVKEEGRDKGKVFKLTEMDAAKAEELALRALFLLEKSGVDLPTDVQGTGSLGVVLAGFKAFCQHCAYEDVKPILDEMWKCIEFIPNPNNHNISHPVLPNEIEEVMTRLNLRMEVFNLHLGFSTGGESSPSIPTSTVVSPPPKSRTTPTSPARLAQSSVLAARRS